MSEKSCDEIWEEWGQWVNMAPKELEDWLASDKAEDVGVTEDGETESKGHKSGRRIVEIKRKTKGDLTDDDWTHMAKVIGYNKRHCAQVPDGDIEDTTWRYSLMNWGHDPIKKDGCA